MLEAPHREGKRKLDALPRRGPAGGGDANAIGTREEASPCMRYLRLQRPTSRVPIVSLLFVFLHAKVEVEGSGEEERYCPYPRSCAGAANGIGLARCPG